MYLFDTDTITNLLKKKPSVKLVKRISYIGKKEQFISTITLSEIFYGAFKSNNAAHHIGQLNTVLLPLVNIIAFDIAAAFHYGKLRSELEKEGKAIPAIDLQIASIALANDLKLITGNLKHFKRIKTLEVEGWIN
ncbi:MAG: PIN domain-containing protein [Actinobacteria bacterium]|nr:PIN domain-containing protein [Actinomycetota bacterium]